MIQHFRHCSEQKLDRERLRKESKGFNVFLFFCMKKKKEQKSS